MRIPGTPVTLLHRLGAGAWGSVWAARHDGADLPMAVKRVRLLDAAFEAAFRNEIESVAALDHAHVLRIYDFGVADLDEGRTGWFATELASGGSYAERPPSDWAGALRLARATLEALAHAHARGVVHRDVKPANLLECGPGDSRPGPKLGDFGVAWRGHAGVAGLAGTPAYLAPEMFTGATASGATDTYAFAVTLWELVADRPFQADSLAGWRAAHTAGPGRMRPRFAVPAELESWLRGLLAPDRPESAARLLAEIGALGEAVELPWTNAGSPPAPGFRTWVERASSPGPRDRGTATVVLSDPGRGALAGGAPRAKAHPPLPVPASWGDEEPWRLDARIGGLNLELLAVRPPRFEGRREERDRLWAALRAVAGEGRSRSVGITGAPGVGKSRLADWLVERSVELGVARAWRLGPGAPSPGELHGAASAGPVIVVADDPGGVASARELVRLARVWPAPVLALLLDADADERIEVGPLDPGALTRLLEHGLGLDAASAVAWAERAAGDLRWLFSTLLCAVRDGESAELPGGRRVPLPDSRRPSPLDSRLAVAALVGPAPVADWTAACAALGALLDDATLADWRRRGLVSRSGEVLRVADPEIVGAARRGATPAERVAAASATRDPLAADRLRLQAGDLGAIDRLLAALAPRKLPPHPAAGLAACEQLDQALPPDDPRRLDLLEVRLNLHGRRGELVAAREIAEALEAAAREAGDLDRAARALSYRGNFLARSGRLDEAAGLFTAALELPSTPATRGQILGFLGNLLRARGELVAAGEAYEGAHAAFLAAGDHLQARSVRFGTAALARIRGDHARAAADLDEMIAGGAYLLAAKLQRALLDAVAGRDEAAWERLAEAREEIRRSLQPNFLGLALATAAAAAAGLGREGDAEAALIELAAVRPYTITSTGDYAEALHLAVDRLADRPALRAQALALLPHG